jgi:hypothetical protein
MNITKKIDKLLNEVPVEKEAEEAREFKKALDYIASYDMEKGLEYAKDKPEVHWKTIARTFQRVAKTAIQKGRLRK